MHEKISQGATHSLKSLSFKGIYKNIIPDKETKLKCLKLRTIPVDTNLNGFFNHVVENEETEDEFTCHDEVVHHAHVTDQLHRSQRPVRDCPTCWRKLHCQSENKWQINLVAQ